MGFWTSILYYRPGPPVRATTCDLADFVDGCVGIARRRDKNLFGSRVKFGSAIDRDDLGIHEVADVAGTRGLVQTISSRPADLEFGHPKSLHEVAAALREREAVVYRAFISLGLLPEDACLRLHVPSDRNVSAVWPYDLSLRLMPVTLGSLVSDEAPLVS